MSLMEGENFIFVFMSDFIIFILHLKHGISYVYVSTAITTISIIKKTSLFGQFYKSDDK